MLPASHPRAFCRTLNRPAPPAPGIQQNHTPTRCRHALWKRLCSRAAASGILPAAAALSSCCCQAASCHCGCCFSLLLRCLVLLRRLWSSCACQLVSRRVQVYVCVMCQQPCRHARQGRLGLVGHITRPEGGVNQPSHTFAHTIHITAACRCNTGAIQVPCRAIPSPARTHARTTPPPPSISTSVAVVSQLLLLGFRIQRVCRGDPQQQAPPAQHQHTRLVECQHQAQVALQQLTRHLPSIRLRGKPDRDRNNGKWMAATAVDPRSPKQLARIHLLGAHAPST